MAIKSKYWRLELYPTKEQLERDGLAIGYDGSAGYGSLPDDWLDILKQTCLPMAISPLHDHDTKADGSIKKPHYHVVINYPSSNTTLKAVKERITDRLAAPTPFVADNPRGAYEYLWHKNDTDKYQYDKTAVLEINGYKVPLSTDDVQILKAQLQDFIREYDIFEYADFLDAVKDNFGSDSDEYNCATNHTILFNTYITSRRHKCCNQVSNE